MSPHRDQYRSYRRWWWFRPGVLLPALILSLLSVPMVWWISTYKSDIAVAMFVITYAALLLIYVRMMRSAILEPHIRVHERELRQVEGRLADDRRATFAALARAELEMLARGDIIPVLDVWQIDADRRRRHGFIANTVMCLADPSARELRIRIHLSPEWTLVPGSRQMSLFLKEVASYLRLLESDTLALALVPFIATVIVEVRVHREDAGMTGWFEPVLSLAVAWPDLRRAAPDLHPPFLPGDVRFADGAPVEPHREIPAGASTGTK